MQTQLYDSTTLLGVFRDNEAMRPPSSYWLDMAFKNTVLFETEHIDFSMVTDQRKLAPLVVPTAQGQPVYSSAEATARFKPAYVKPKDVVSASRMIQRIAGRGEMNSGPPMGAEQRYNAVVADILRTHRRAIERYWEWLAAKAVIDGKVTLSGKNYPGPNTVDFKRAPAHTVTLAANQQWDKDSVSIIDQIEGWKDILRQASFGGAANRITLGGQAWKAMRKNTEVRELLSFDYKGSSNGMEMGLGVREGLDAEYVGRLNGTTEVWVYSDFYHKPDGTVEPFMDPRDVVLTGPNLQGVRCFGAIQDVDAVLKPLGVFPKMWKQEDPSATFIMTQSAPLMVPVNPNASFRARVVA